MCEMPFQKRESNNAGGCGHSLESDALQTETLKHQGETMIKNEEERKYREAMADAIAGLITEETGFATTQRKPFADGCHVYGALTEEWRESNDHIIAIETLIDEFLDNCISGDMPSEIITREHLSAIIFHCKKLIMEITQVAAVSAKAGITLEDWINE